MVKLKSDDLCASWLFQNFGTITGFGTITSPLFEFLLKTTFEAKSSPKQQPYFKSKSSIVTSLKFE